MPSNFLDLQNTKGITVRGRFVRKLKLVPTITNLKKQGLVLQKKFPTPYDDYKGRQQIKERDKINELEDKRSVKIMMWIN